MFQFLRNNAERPNIGEYLLQLPDCRKRQIIFFIALSLFLCSDMLSLLLREMFYFLHLQDC